LTSMPKKKVGGKKKGVRCDAATVTPSCRPASPMPLTHPYHSVGISRAYSTFSSPHPRTGCQEGDREEDSCQQEQGASLASLHYFRHSPPLGSCLPSDAAAGCSSLHAASIIRSPCPPHLGNLPLSSWLSGARPSSTRTRTHAILRRYSEWMCWRTRQVTSAVKLVG